jgi:hypothetical protein
VLGGSLCLVSVSILCSLFYYRALGPQCSPDMLYRFYRGGSIDNVPTRRVKEGDGEARGPTCAPFKNVL